MKMKQMIKKIKTMKMPVLIIMVLMMIFISGCGGFKRGQGQIESYDFRQGIEGIAMQFLEGMPPNHMFVGTDFSTGVRIKNMGAYDITDRADLSIVVNKEAFRFDKGDTQQFVLRGRSLYTREGEEDIIMFPLRSLCYPGYGGTKETIVLRNYTTKVQATACYYYETTANADLCVDTMKHLRKPGDKLVCDMQDIVFSGGQGGPVGAVKVTPSVIPRSEDLATLQLSISFKKLQERGLWVYQKDAGCDEPKEENKVEIDVMVGGQRMVCEPYQVQLKARSAVGTVCKADIAPSMGAYKTQIRIIMKYKVKQSILKDLVVEPPPAGVNCQALKGGAIS